MIIKYISEINTTKLSGKQEDNIAQYKNVPGVWILLGKEEYNTPVVCLQVGQSKDIGGEIYRDITYLNDKNLAPTPKVYINQFGESMFPYEEYPNRAKLLYYEIAKKYNYLSFVCVAHGVKNNNLRKDIEKYVAYKTLSLYWVNGSQYKKERSKEAIELIKEACKDECTSLYAKIKMNYPENANSLNEFLEKLISGKIDIPNC